MVVAKKQPKTSRPKKFCLKCEREKDADKNFYKSNSTLFTDSLFPVCKTCIRNELKLENPTSKEAIDSLKPIFQQMNRPFIYNLWISSIEESQKGNKDLFGVYWKNVQLNYKDLTWNDSDFGLNNESDYQIENKFQYEIVDNPTPLDIESQDRKDVLKMLGYDPFIFENEEDRPRLYTELANYLDESTLEDGFKVQAVIEIVIAYNQIDKINRAITQIIKNPDKMTSGNSGIKTLIDSKKNILASILSLAKDNGISVNHNNNKSKGGNTLNGIVKKLNEIGLSSAELNLFDLETSNAMRQVADFSNKSIIDQLMLDENEYSDMIVQQRELIQQLDSKLIKEEETNRLLRVEIAKLKGELSEMNI